MDPKVGRSRRQCDRDRGFQSCFFHVLLPPFFVILCSQVRRFNECISILENISEIGVPLPAFLLKLIDKLKKTVENTEGGVCGLFHGVGVCGIACDLDSNRPVVVRAAGSTPRAVFFLDVHTDTPVEPDTVVRARLPGGRQGPRIRAESRRNDLDGA